MKFQDFIPPILARSLKKPSRSRDVVSSSRFFLTYTEAQKACDGTGYEQAELVRTVFEKTKLAKDKMLNGKFPLTDAAAQSLLAVLFCLQDSEMPEQIKVVDFGGACGAHYFQSRRFLPPELKLDWMVVETPAMVEKARAFETDELRFCGSLLEAKEKLQVVNLLHSSGALQYVPDPWSTIQEFIACRPAYIFLNRLALSGSETIITVQESFLSANGPGALPEHLVDRLCRYPVTYFPKFQLEELLCESYQIKFSFAETKTLLDEKEIIANAGMFLERHL